MAATSDGGQDVILVVDDDRTMRLLARQSLEVAGFAVTEARGGREALLSAERLRPSLVLLDVDMPDLDGFAVCAQLRGLDHFQDTPVLMMTGLNDVASVRRAYEVGATDFIDKPPNWVILSHRVRYILRASEAMRDLRSSESKLASAQSLADLAWWEWDRLNDRFSCSDLFFRIFGVDEKSFSPSYPAFLDCLQTAERQRAAATLDPVVNSGGSCELEYAVHRPDGSRRIVHQRTRATPSSAGAPVRVVCALQDITDRKRDEEQIRHLAYFDGLTGLPNRTLFLDRLDQVLEHARRYRRLAAVLFLDLDRFKRVNDTLGHGAGDDLLCAAGKRLHTCMRSGDCVSRMAASDSEALIARLGGDEFTVLLSEINREQDAARVAQRVIAALTAPFQLGGHEVTMTASIGIALYPNDATGAVDLLKNADTAMYHAKDQGRNNYQFYTESMNATALEHLTLENDLRRALERNQFILHYQPQVDTASGAVVGAEALLRWQHPELGLVPPMDFIPIAEETGLVVPIGQWVLHTACAHAAQWQRTGHPPLPVSVNVSGRQLCDTNFSSTVAAALRSASLSPRLLDLELTETVVMEDAEENIRVLSRLKQLGVRVSVDDFGTGYSSLSYLKRFPLDALKIDRSFLSGVPHDADHVAIATAIVAMAHSLRLQPIAEGVETEAQLTFLHQHGCDTYQGYLASRPLPLDAFLEFVQTRSDTPVDASAEPAPRLATARP